MEPKLLLPEGRRPRIENPDALFLRESAKRGRRLIDRINSILEIAEPLLGVDRSQGQRGYIRRQEGGWLFITKDPEDTIYHALSSPLRGRDRYAWVVGADGIKRGYLTEEARAAAVQHVPPGTIKDIG
jgi:hypothetical protein